MIKVDVIEWGNSSEKDCGRKVTFGLYRTEEGIQVRLIKKIIVRKRVF